MRSLRGEQDAGEGGEQAGGDEGDDRVAANRHAVERRRLRIGADRVEIAADRQIFEDEPKRDRQREHVEAGDRQAEQIGAVQRERTLRATPTIWRPLRVPHRDRVEHRAGAERRDEASICATSTSTPLIRPTPAPSTSTTSDRQRPGNAVPGLQADRQNVPQHDAVADGEVDLARRPSGSSPPSDRMAMIALSEMIERTLSRVGNVSGSRMLKREREQRRSGSRVRRPGRSA